MVKTYKVLAGSRWRNVRVSGSRGGESTLTFRYHGRNVSIKGFVPDRYEDYVKAKITLLTDSYIRQEKSRAAILKTASEKKLPITFL